MSIREEMARIAGERQQRLDRDQAARTPKNPLQQRAELRAHAQEILERIKPAPAQQPSEAEAAGFDTMSGDEQIAWLQAHGIGTI